MERTSARSVVCSTPSAPQTQVDAREHNLMDMVGQRRTVSRLHDVDQGLITDLGLDTSLQISDDGYDLPADVDIDNDDMESVLGTNDDQPAEYDHRETIRRAYTRKCLALQVVPVGRVLRGCGGEQLDLGNHPLGPRGARALAAALVMATTLTRVDVSGCDVQPSGVRYLSQALLENHFIQHLGLANNSLGQQGVDIVCSMMAYNTNILSLNLAGNKITDSVSTNLGTLLRENHTLTDLNLSNNDLCEEAGAAIGDALAVNDTLCSLDLSWNKLRFKGIKMLSKGLKENVRLHTLSLSYTGVGQDGAAVLGAALSQNEALTRLDMETTRLTDPAIILLAKGLELNDTLRTLNISKNPYTHVGAYGVLKAIEKNVMNTSMKMINMYGITVDVKFLDILEDLQANDSSLEVIYNSIPLRRGRLDPVQIMFKWMDDHARTLHHVFGVTKGDSSNLITREEFVIKLKDAKIPMDAEERLNLSNKLDLKERGLPNLSLLYGWWDQHLDMRPHKEQALMSPSGEETSISGSNIVNEAADNERDHTEQLSCETTIHKPIQQRTTHTKNLSKEQSEYIIGNETDSWMSKEETPDT